jgi:hypothetical protein
VSVPLGEALLPYISGPDHPLQTQHALQGEALLQRALELTVANPGKESLHYINMLYAMAQVQGPAGTARMRCPHAPHRVCCPPTALPC